MWVLIFGGIALVALILLIAYAVWLWHKASDMFSEVKVLGRRAEELAALVDQIQVPQPVSSSPTHSVDVN